MRRRHLLRGAAAAAVVGGFSAGCAEPPPAANTDLVDPGKPAPTASPTPSLPAAPLSGQPAASEAVASRPALAVTLRVTKGTTPAGLTAADIIFQEYAESGSLHVAAVFQSRDAAKIGPVTEVRPVDIRTLGVLRPFVAYDGGPTGFLAQFKDSGLKGVTPGQESSAFDGDYTSTAALYKVAPKDGLPPSPVFDFAGPGVPLAEQGTAPAATLSVAVPGQPTQVWRYDRASTTWRGQLGKATVAAGAVIVLNMPYRTIDVRKPVYRELPSAKVFGEGAGVAVSGGFSVKTTWRKPSQRMLCNVLDPTGSQIRVQPGTTWVVYAPPNAKVTVA